jgi:hypothetical protein
MKNGFVRLGEFDNAGALIAALGDNINEERGEFG